MKLRKYNLDQLIEAISSSISKRQCLEKLGIKACGGNYKTLDAAILYFKLDTSHFTGQNLSGRKLPARRKPVEEYLIKGSSIQSNKLKRYLLSSKYLEYKCSMCNLSEWLGNPICLELDHINGDSKDNTLTNLRLLCPNCHSTTSTWRGRNIKPRASLGISS